MVAFLSAHPANERNPDLPAGLRMVGLAFPNGSGENEQLHRLLPGRLRDLTRPLYHGDWMRGWQPSRVQVRSNAVANGDMALGLPVWLAGLDSIFAFKLGLGAELPFHNTPHS